MEQDKQRHAGPASRGIRGITRTLEPVPRFVRSAIQVRDGEV